MVGNPDVGHDPGCQPIAEASSVARNLKRNLLLDVSEGEPPAKAYSRLQNRTPLAALENNVPYDQLVLEVPCERRVGALCAFHMNISN